MRGAVAGLTFVVRVGAQLRRCAARCTEIDVFCEQHMVSV